MVFSSIFSAAFAWGILKMPARTQVKFQFFPNIFVSSFKSLLRFSSFFCTELGVMYSVQNLLFRDKNYGKVTVR